MHFDLIYFCNVSETIQKCFGNITKMVCFLHYLQHVLTCLIYDSAEQMTLLGLLFLCLSKEFGLLE